MRKWESQINRLIRGAAARRPSDRNLPRLSGRSMPSSRATSSVGTVGSAYSYSSASPYSSTPTAYTPGSSAKIAHNPSYNNNVYHEVAGGYPTGPSGYPSHDHDGFTDDDDFEEYPATTSSSYTSSGRGTPVNGRTIPTPIEIHHEQRSRAYTEDVNGTTMSQWRNQQQLSIPSQSQFSAHSPGGVSRPITPRTQASSQSFPPDTTYGSVAPPQRPPLKSQFSSTRLKNGYENSESRNRAPTPTHSNAGAPPPHAQQQYTPQLHRSRSASQPSAYVPPMSAPPPLPTHSINGSYAGWGSREPGTTGNKRGSGSSQSTAGSSDYSPNSSSPITPFGSSESSLGGINANGHHVNGVSQDQSLPVKVKVHFHEDIFVIQVPRATEYGDLVQKVGKKIRLCGPRRDDGPLRVKYRDEDGDMVSLGSTEDVQIAFESFRPGGQVTLFVT